MVSVSLVPIFATPLAVVDLTEALVLNERLLPLLQSRTTPAWRDPALPEDALCFRSREDLLEWPEAPVRQLIQVLLAGLCAAVRDASLYKESEFAELGLQARGRLTVVRPYGAVPATSAPLASWAGIYCVAAPEPSATRADSAAVRIYAIRSGTMFFDAANSRLRAPFSQDHQFWRPVPGQMVVFPAAMLHEIALNHSTGDLVLVTVRARFAHAGQKELPPW